ICQCIALGIFENLERTGWVPCGERGSHKGMTILECVERPDNVRLSATKVCVCARDIQRSSGKEVENHTDVPFLDHSCQRSTAIGEQQLVRSHRQLESTVEPEIVLAAAVLDVPVQIPIQYVQPGRRAAGIVGRDAALKRIRCLNVGSLSRTES